MCDRRELVVVVVRRKDSSCILNSKFQTVSNTHSLDFLTSLNTLLLLLFYFTGAAAAATTEMGGHDKADQANSRSRQNCKQRRQLPTTVVKLALSRASANEVKMCETHTN